MDQELEQLVQAILIAADPTSGNLHQQALEYLSTVQQNATNTWRVALSLFVDRNPDGSRKYPTAARFFALRVLDEFLDNRYVFVYSSYFVLSASCSLFSVCKKKWHRNGYRTFALDTFEESSHALGCHLFSCVSRTGFWLHDYLDPCTYVETNYLGSSPDLSL